VVDVEPSVAASAPPPPARGWIRDWEPEDEQFWQRRGRKVARRNLIFSIFAEHLGFSMWLLWSVVVLFLTPRTGYDFSTRQLFWLVAMPNLVGSFLRIPYTFAVAKFGGRNWTVVSALLLLIPTLLLVYCVTTQAPYWMFLIASATAGFGGGNFASSMANISYFYPERKKGWALGINAAGGNIGVAVVQLVVPLAVASALFGADAAKTLTDSGVIARAAYVYLPFIVLAAVCAWFFMDNLTVSMSPLREQLGALKDQHAWVMSFLYIGTFGSFIGYSAALGLVIRNVFPDVVPYHYAFLGPLVGSISRPLGGWLSDRLGGARVTQTVFAVNALGALSIIGAVDARHFVWFLGSFLLLFVATGIGNGSTYRSIPSIFRARALQRVSDADGPTRQQALALGARHAAAVIGIAGAIGAFGGFLIPITFGTALKATGTVVPALSVFIAFYAVCLAVNWFCYLRRDFLTHRVPSLAQAAI
jgi:MFS transporter, NNP family, nitrate/nitrite transporter